MRVSQIFGLFVAAINLTGLASAANHAFSCDDKDLMEQCNQWCNCYDDHVNCGPGVTVGNKQWKLTTPGSRQARCYYECQCLGKHASRSTMISRTTDIPHRLEELFRDKLSSSRLLLRKKGRSNRKM